MCVCVCALNFDRWQSERSGRKSMLDDCRSTGKGTKVNVNVRLPPVTAHWSLVTVRCSLFNRDFSLASPYCDCWHVTIEGLSHDSSRITGGSPHHTNDSSEFSSYLRQFTFNR